MVTLPIILKKMVHVIGIQNYFLLAEPKPVNLTIYFRVFVACNLL